MNESTQEAQEKFLLVFGQTVMTWGQIESAICKLFSWVTRMDPTLARRVFYSARSFTGRTDMLKAAISCPTVQFPMVEDADFLRECVKVCSRYSAVRNVIAHDSIVFLGFSGHEFSNQWVIVDGKYDRFLGGEDAMPISQLDKFHHNISHLFYILQGFIQRNPQNAASQSRLCLSLLQKLPKVPREDTLDPHDATLAQSLFKGGFSL